MTRAWSLLGRNDTERGRIAAATPEASVMHPRAKFARLVAAVAVVTAAIAVVAPAAGGMPPFAIGRDRVAFALDPCPIAMTIEAHDRIAVAAGGYLLDAALIAPPGSEGGFECPINRTPASNVALAWHSSSV